MPPDIIYDDTSADLAVQENDNATLSCKATGRPSPRITWRREDGEPILVKKPGTNKDMYKSTYKIFNSNSIVSQFSNSVIQSKTPYFTDG